MVSLILMLVVVMVLVHMATWDMVAIKGDMETPTPVHLAWIIMACNSSSNKVDTVKSRVETSLSSNSLIFINNLWACKEHPPKLVPLEVHHLEEDGLVSLVRIGVEIGNKRIERRNRLSDFVF